MPAETDIKRAEKKELAAPPRLPTRAEIAPELYGERDVVRKNINRTFGGKIINGFINYGLGWIGNSVLSLGFTYFLNPQNWVKDLKVRVTATILRFRKGGDQKSVHDSVRSTVEILFMTIAGFIATIGMSLLIPHREKIAYRINQWFGKDKDVIPEEMKPRKEPRTLEEQVERDIDSRVNKRHNGFDLWTARLITLAAVIWGDYVVNRSSRRLEARGKQSVDTLSWRLGQKLHDTLHPDFVNSINKNFFSKHGAGPEHMEANMKAHYQRLVATEKKFATTAGELNLDRMAISEQTRIFVKEFGWTLILASIVAPLTGVIHNMRLGFQRKRALHDMTKAGIIPEGYRVKYKDDLVIQRVPAEGESKKADASWKERSGERPENHIAGVDTSRAGNERLVMA